MTTLFQNRVFRIVALADLMQQLAIWVRNIALLFYVMEQTNNDPVAVSLLTVFEYAPIFLFSFIGGAFADRWNPKRTMIAGDLLSALSVAAILLFVLAGSWQAVFAATIVSAIVSQFSQPSSAIMFKRHVPEELVGAAIGITQSLMSLFIIVGPIIGTLLYSLLGITNSLVILIGLFLAAAAIQLALPPSPRNPERRTVPILEDIKEGIRYVRGSRNLVVIALMFACIGLGSGIIQPLDIYIVTERLGLDKENIQWFYALSGAGMLIGGAAAGGRRHEAEPAGRCVYRDRVSVAVDRDRSLIRVGAAHRSDALPGRRHDGVHANCSRCAHDKNGGGSLHRTRERSDYAAAHGRHSGRFGDGRIPDEDFYPRPCILHVRGYHLDRGIRQSGAAVRDCSKLSGTPPGMMGDKSSNREKRPRRQAESSCPRSLSDEGNRIGYR